MSVILECPPERHDPTGIASLRLSVLDEGPGIPDDERERIFEKFETGSKKGKGTAQVGLGLAFVKRAVEAHGGQVRVDVNKPQGSIFVVEL